MNYAAPDSPTAAEEVTMPECRRHWPILPTDKAQVGRGGGRKETTTNICDLGSSVKCVHEIQLRGGDFHLSDIPLTKSKIQYRRVRKQNILWMILWMP